MGAKVDERSAVEIDFLDVMEAVAHVQECHQVEVTIQFSTEGSARKYVVLCSILADGLRDSDLAGSGVCLIGQVERSRLYQMSRTLHAAMYRLEEELSRCKVMLQRRRDAGEHDAVCQVACDLTGGTIIK